MSKRLPDIAIQVVNIDQRHFICDSILSRMMLSWLISNFLLHSFPELISTERSLASKSLGWLAFSSYTIYLRLSLIACSLNGEFIMIVWKNISSGHKVVLKYSIS